jgi:hypothetical protein
MRKNEELPFLDEGTMFVQIFRRAWLLLGAFILLGCMTVGSKFDIANVDQLRPGVSSLTDAKALLGPPTAESTHADGAKLLQWQYSQGTLVGGSGAHAAILFDATGMMVRVIHKFAMR